MVLRRSAVVVFVLLKINHLPRCSFQGPGKVGFIYTFRRSFNADKLLISGSTEVYLFSLVYYVSMMAAVFEAWCLYWLFMLAVLAILVVVKFQSTSSDEVKKNFYNSCCSVKPYLLRICACLLVICIFVVILYIIWNFLIIQFYELISCTFVDKCSASFWEFVSALKICLSWFKYWLEIAAQLYILKVVVIKMFQIVIKPSLGFFSKSSAKLKWHEHSWKPEMPKTSENEATTTANKLLQTNNSKTEVNLFSINFNFR